MKYLIQIIQFIFFRSKISHHYFGHQVDNFFEVLEYNSLEKNNLEDKNSLT